MALASLKIRIERLEAKHKAAAGKPKGVIGGLRETYVEEIDGVLYLRRPETPTGEAFKVYAKNQQNALQAELLGLFADTTDDEPEAQKRAPLSVGIVNNPAPLKPGQKQPNFVHLADGTEISLNRT
jgi:hypothetical protein